MTSNVALIGATAVTIDDDLAGSMRSRPPRRWARSVLLR